MVWLKWLPWKFIIHALLCAGLIDRAERALDRFPARQNALGYFHSQDGEWDSNGEALWIMRRFCELTGRPPKRDWWHSIHRGARWIYKKRLPYDHDAFHSGLLPPGFSAEHLGPNDYYYWDDFWGVAGLQAAAYLAESMGDKEGRRSPSAPRRLPLALSRSPSNPKGIRSLSPGKGHGTLNRLALKCAFQGLTPVLPGRINMPSS